MGAQPQPLDLSVPVLPAILRRPIVIPRDPVESRGADMQLPQDIRPVFQDIQDTLVRSEAPWIQQSPMSAVKVLWWAVRPALGRPCIIGK